MERRELEEVLRNEIRVLAIHTREELNLTQRQMAERLLMSESCYSNIETGRSGSSSLTLLLLLEMQENTGENLHNLCEELRRLNKSVQ